MSAQSLRTFYLSFYSTYQTLDIVKSTIPIELIEQFNRNNVLLFVGEGINRRSLPSSAELAAELAQRCDYPAEEPLTLPRVTGYYELVRDRPNLVTFLLDRLDIQGLGPARAHQLIAHLRPRTIVTTCYDRLLEQALQEINQPYTAIVGNTDVAFAEENKTMLVWIWGVLDQPDTLIITEDDHRNFLENRGNLSDVLRGELARRTWLFVGFDLEDEWFRGFYDTVQRGLDRYGRRAYVFGATPGDYTRLWWEKRNVSILETSVTQFLEMLISQLKVGMRLHAQAVRSEPDLPAEPLPSSPYKRLDYYRENDRALFFGRNLEIEQLSARIHAHRLVLFYGVSGTGKTSILQAGVIPRLKYSDPSYSIIAVRALEDIRVSIRNAVARQLDSMTIVPDKTLVEILAQATRELGPIVLVIDQFEEFFTHFDAETRQQIIYELGSLYKAQDVPVKIVFSLRADYLARMDELEGQLAEIFRIRFQLQPLTPNQARQTIVEPVRMMGKSYDPALIDRLLTDLMDEGVMPSQLQLVCSTLYDQLSPDDSRISLAKYETLGEATGILKMYLTGELSLLRGPERTLARAILKELIDSQGNRYVCTREELANALSIDQAELRTVLEKLVRSYLVRPLDLEQRGETGYELAHEYLIAEIEQWFDPQETERKRARELLKQDINRWQQFKTPIAGSTLDILAPHWENLILQPDERNLILRSAIQQDWNIPDWIKRLDQQSDSTDLLLELLRDPAETIRWNAARCWRYMSDDTIDEKSLVETALVEMALNDPIDYIRAEAAISLARRVPQHGVELIMNYRGETSQARQVEALAHIWDETEPLRQLPTGWRLPVVLVLARIRLKQSSWTLLFHGLAGFVGGIVTMLPLALLLGPLEWVLSKPKLEAEGYTFYSNMASWLVVVPGITSLVETMMILISTMPLVLLKQPKRWLVLLNSSLLVGVIVGLLMGLLYIWDTQIAQIGRTLWWACFNGFVVGSLLGGSVAELLYRRYISGRMPPPLIGFLIGASVGVVHGLITSFSIPPHENFIFWMVSNVSGATLLVGGINLVIHGADRFFEGLLLEDSKGGGFK